MTLTIDYPASLPDALRMSSGEFEQEARLAMAAKLYEMGRLSSGQAAALTSLPRVRFLMELPRLGISLSNMSDDEAFEYLMCSVGR